MPTMIANYDGYCNICKKPIKAGDKIHWERGKGSSHYECFSRAAPSSPSSTPSVAPTMNHDQAAALEYIKKAAPAGTAEKIKTIYLALMGEHQTYVGRPIKKTIRYILQGRFPGKWNVGFYIRNKTFLNKIGIRPAEIRGAYYIILETVEINTTGKGKVKADGTTVASKGKATFSVNNRENFFTITTDPPRLEDELYRLLAKFSQVEYKTGGGDKKKTLTAVFVGRRLAKLKKSAKTHDRTKELVADIGMLYYFADHAQENGYDVKIVDHRGQNAKNPIPLEHIEAATTKARLAIKKSPFKYRTYQREAIEAALKRKNGILRLATGSGKTEIAIGLIGQIGGDALFVVPRVSLAKQTYARLKDAGFKNVGILYGDVKEIEDHPKELDVNVVVINTGKQLLGVKRSILQIPYDTLTPAQRKKVAELNSSPEKKRKYIANFEKSKAEGDKIKRAFYNFVQQSDVVVFDEAHHVKADDYATFAVSDPASFRYGLSATPFADDELQTAFVREKLGDILYDLPASSLIAHADGNRYLSTPIFKLIPYSHDAEIASVIEDMKKETYVYMGGEKKEKHPDYGAIVNAWTGISEGSDHRFQKRRYPLCFLRHILTQNDGRNKLIAVIAKELASRKMPTIIVVETISHGVNIKKACDKIGGIRSEMVASREDTSDDDEDEEDEGDETGVVQSDEEDDGESEIQRIEGLQNAVRNHSSVNIITENEDREVVFNKMKTGELDIMIGTSGLIGEGLDIPDLMAIIIAQGGKSFTRAYQRAGRVMRLHDKERGFRSTHSLVIEIYDCLSEKRVGLGFGGYGTPRDDIIVTTPPILEGFHGIKYFGEHFENRLTLYQDEAEFVLAWARSMKDVFGVDYVDKEGKRVSIDPWVRGNAAKNKHHHSKKGNSMKNKTGSHRTAVQDNPRPKVIPVILRDDVDENGKQISVRKVTHAYLANKRVVVKKTARNLRVKVNGKEIEHDPTGNSLYKVTGGKIPKGFKRVTLKKAFKAMDAFHATVTKR